MRAPGAGVAIPFAPGQRDVVLVVPPVASASSPALGPSLLAAGLAARGVGVAVLYGTLRFAARVGLEVNERLARASSEALPGEALFAAAAFPELLAGEPAPTFVARHLAAAVGPRSLRAGPAQIFDPASAAQVAEVQACLDHVGPVLDELGGAILAAEPRIVGIGSAYRQVLASLALARWLKERRPELLVVLGGPNLARPMAEATVELCDAVDLAVAGEADEVFVELCVDYLDRGRRPSTRVVVCPPLDDLDRARTPDYRDYFTQLAPLVAAGRLPESLPAWLHVEGSRGCRWGERHPCSFCGLDGPLRRHRAKAPERVLAELDELADRHRVRRFQLTDNLLPETALQRLLPALAERPRDLELFWEVRPDLTAEELDLVVLAGVAGIQPGIESLASGVLRRLGKGTTGVRNLVFLRDCASRGLAATWNLLLAVPGESAADYRALLRLLPAVEHLQPPVACGPVRVDRFSPYFDRPERFGLRDVRPWAAYSRLLPPGARVADLASHFEAEVPSGLLDDPPLLDELRAAVSGWQRAWVEGARPPRLAAVPLGDGLELVEDTRRVARQRFSVLTPPQADALRRLDLPCTEGGVAGHDRPAVEALRRLAFVVEHERRLVSVVTRPGLGIRLRERRRRALARGPRARAAG